MLCGSRDTGLMNCRASNPLATSHVLLFQDRLPEASQNARYSQRQQPLYRQPVNLVCDMQQEYFTVAAE